MNIYKETDFTKIAISGGKFVLVAEASQLRWPVGRILASFKIEGYGQFNYDRSPEANCFNYYNSAGIVAQVFND